MSDVYKFGYTLDETIETMRDVIDTGNHDRMFLDTYYWLKILSEYRKIGTVEEFREAVEKQKAKKPEVIDQDFDRQATAFDKEKVIEKLKDQYNYSRKVRDKNNNVYFEYWDGRTDSYKDAIEIVEKGGIE